MDLGVKKCHDQDDKILADDHVIILPNSLIGDLKSQYRLIESKVIETF
jgi:hypothetical protein